MILQFFSSSNCRHFWWPSARWKRKWSQEWPVSFKICLTRNTERSDSAGTPNPASLCSTSTLCTKTGTRFWTLIPRIYPRSSLTPTKYRNRKGPRISSGLLFLLGLGEGRILVLLRLRLNSPGVFNTGRSFKNLLYRVKMVWTRPPGRIRHF